MLLDKKLKIIKNTVHKFSKLQIILAQSNLILNLLLFVQKLNRIKYEYESSGDGGGCGGG